MRNLLGRLHARRLPELLRIAEAWNVPLAAENKGDVVAALYRTMIDPRAVRDIWSRFTPDQRALVESLVESPESSPPPTLAVLAEMLGVPETTARETALDLYRIGVLAREGDDEPLPIGESPRLLLPRELAGQFRRIQDEIAAGNLANTPLRVLVELLDDAELENAARMWGLRLVPGVARRQEIVPRLLRLVNDRDRVERVARGRSRDAAAIWQIVRGAGQPAALTDVMHRVALDRPGPQSAARLRAALTELEGTLLVWHAFASDGSRLLFVPEEIRSPAEHVQGELPPLQSADVPADPAPHWVHPDALAWDLLTLIRVMTDTRGPAWQAGDPPPRWLRRIVAPRLWFHAPDGPPDGYLELLQALALGEGVLALDDERHPPRLAIGPDSRSWRGLSFPDQTARLRERWLRLSRWVEGEASGLVDVWGADWRGFRPRLLRALADSDLDLTANRWVTLESLAARLAAAHPSLLGPSFTAATARQAEDEVPGLDDGASRAAALADVIAFELAGPFVWFRLTETFETPGLPAAISLTESGLALAARKPLADSVGRPTGEALRVSPDGEITLLAPTPARIWALGAVAEPVDLDRESHFRLTLQSIATALGNGIEPSQIERFLAAGLGGPVPLELAALLAEWARRFRRIQIERAVILRLDTAGESTAAIHTLAAAGWQTAALDERTLLVSLADRDRDREAEIVTVLQEAGFTPVNATAERTDPTVTP